MALIWGAQDVFLTADEQLPRLIDLLDVPEEEVVVLQHVKHLVADEAPEAIVNAF